MAQFHRGEISVRKLTVLCKYLPSNSPAYWSEYDGRYYSQESSLLWNMLWALWELQVLTAKLHGNKKARMPQDKVPKFPWSKIEDNTVSKFGKLGEHTQEEAIEYLKNL